MPRLEPFSTAGTSSLSLYRCIVRSLPFFLNIAVEAGRMQRQLLLKTKIQLNSGGVSIAVAASTFPLKLKRCIGSFNVIPAGFTLQREFQRCSSSIKVAATSSTV